jgi:hypothetical protein
VTNIYTLPFSKSVWATYMTAAAVLAVAWYATARLERWANPTRTDPPVAFVDTAMNSLAIVCSEGEKRFNWEYRKIYCFFWFRTDVLYKAQRNIYAETKTVCLSAVIMLRYAATDINAVIPAPGVVRLGTPNPLTPGNLGEVVT